MRRRMLRWKLRSTPIFGGVSDNRKRKTARSKRKLGGRREDFPGEEWKGSREDAGEGSEKEFRGEIQRRTLGEENFVY